MISVIQICRRFDFGVAKIAIIIGAAKDKIPFFVS
jgi:hypothetical protein